MENTNSGHNAFIEKTKKQAKRLLKLAQSKDSNLKITNLSSAQEILAQINGYPHWHALESTINNNAKNFEKNIVINSSTDKFINDKKINNIIDGVNYFTQGNKIVSVFEVTNIYQNDLSGFKNEIENLKNKCSLQFNMGFHEVGLIISSRNKESSRQKYSFTSLSELLGLETSLLKKLFSIDNYTEKTTEFCLSALLVIKTESEMESEHIEFCSNFNEKNSKIHSFSLRDYLTNEEYSIIHKEEEKIKQRVLIGNDYDLSLKKIIHNEGFVHLNHNAWIHAISLLHKRSFEWDIEVNLNESRFTFYQLQANKTHETYVSGLYKSLNINNNIDKPQMFNLSSKVSSLKMKWQKGIPFIDQDDNSICYYEPGSELQEFHNSIIIGKPGSGKSLLMNAINLFSLGVDSSKLPNLVTIDIGSSSRPLIEFLKSILPDEKKHLAGYHRLKITRDYCINVFDTPIGCRLPTESHKMFLANFISLIVMDSYGSIIETGMAGLVLAAIDEMYLQLSDDFHPKRYEEGINALVDESLKNIGAKINNNTSWWSIVDLLFKNGYVYEAKLAQRHAVPFMIDAPAFVQHKKIKDVYGKMIASNGEGLIEYFNRSLTDALHDYKILAKFTTFDIDEQSIVSIDLDEVAKSGGPQGEKQTAVMYMLAKYLAERKYKQSDRDIKNIKSIDEDALLGYQEYHKQYNNQMSDFRKVIVFDEFHRVSKNTIVRQEIQSDFRESRKWKIELMLTTQSLNDLDLFQEESVESSITSLFMMDLITRSELNSLSQSLQSFILNNVDLDMLSKAHGPRRGKPGVFFAKFLTHRGTIKKLLSFKTTPYLHALLSSTYEDSEIRKKLLTKFSMEKTLDIMVAEFPYGIKAEIEKEFKYPYPGDILDVVFDRLLKKYS